MQTLSYGYKKPQTDDLGSTFFPALEADIQQLNDHNHNGINSAPLSGASITKTSQSISSAGWVATSGGRYRQEVTLPGTLTYSNTLMQFFIAGASDDRIYPTIEEGTAANKYYIYVNDNTLNLMGLYL